MKDPASINWPAGPRHPELPPDEIHFWCAHSNQAAGIHEELHALLSEDERAKAAAFVFEKDRNTSIVARGLLRTLLGAYLERSPGAIRFGVMGNDKPVLAGGEALYFNVSHSGDKVLLACTRVGEIGVDIELIRDLEDAVQIAENYFSLAEKTALRRVPPELKSRAFFDCWSRKEAFIKTHGEGLSRDLASFDVSLTPGEPARLISVDGSPARAANWTMDELDPATGYAAAYCVAGKASRIRVHQWP